MLVENSDTRIAKIATSFLALLLISNIAGVSRVSAQRGAETPAQRTETRFETLRNNPGELFAFLLRMPKGGDLHNHLSGAIYAESFIGWAAEKHLCVNQASMALATCDGSVNQVQASDALTNGVLYRQLVDAWSMRNWTLSGQSGHDHFFDTFAKFGLATYDETGAMLAEAVSRAAKGHIDYMELMLTPDNGLSSTIGNKVGWNGDFASTLARLKENHIDEAVAASEKNLAIAEDEKDKLLKCRTPDKADPGCGVTVRYVFQVSRASSLGAVYAQMVAGFMTSSNPGSKVVALNLVQGEDSLTSMQNFTVEMKMLDFLHRQYPGAHITLHAGELAPGLVPPDGLTFHIRQSIDLGHAERIGHGVDIMHETGAVELLREMAARKIMVEICLTSNDVILGVSGKDHPLKTYLEYGVPVALATDDEGVSRSEMSREYLRAAEDQGLNYVQLKMMARNSLQYSFVPGTSIWTSELRTTFTPVRSCAKDLGQITPQSASCREFLSNSEKARLQWRLEAEFAAFEKVQ